LTQYQRKPRQLLSVALGDKRYRWDFRYRTAASIKQPYKRPPVLIALATGARRGEISALRWRNVDMDHGEILFAESARELRLRAAMSR
jgi:integrase